MWLHCGSGENYVHPTRRAPTGLVPSKTFLVSLFISSDLFFGLHWLRRLNPPLLLHYDSCSKHLMTDMTVWTWQGGNDPAQPLICLARSWSRPPPRRLSWWQSSSTSRRRCSDRTKSNILWSCHWYTGMTCLHSNLQWLQLRISGSAFLPLTGFSDTSQCGQRGGSCISTGEIKSDDFKAYLPLTYCGRWHKFVDQSRA